ncbi:hypothetical protein HG531_013332 [Fusarium graminearum]|nr:hypothetical protein HG531_013332 [Fusarium graminearum]
MPSGPGIPKSMPMNAAGLGVEKGLAVALNSGRPLGETKPGAIGGDIRVSECIPNLSRGFQTTNHLRSLLIIPHCSALIVLTNRRLGGNVVEVQIKNDQHGSPLTAAFHETAIPDTELRGGQALSTTPQWQLVENGRI